MKYLLFASILICQSVMAQDSTPSNVFKFKCFQTCRDDSKGSKELSDSDFQDVDFLVVLNLDKSRINTYGKKSAQFDIIKIGDKYLTSKGHTVFPYTCIDPYGDEVKVDLVLFKDQSLRHIATLALHYSYADFLFRLASND